MPLVYVDHRGHHLEYEWIEGSTGGAPLVFLHEGLGSVELWRDFPRQVATATDRRGLVYSRYGHGRSDRLQRPRSPQFMHEEALQSLPGLVDDLVQTTPVLVGHSDGASISMIYAGSGHLVDMMVLIAPHVMVEPHGLHQIRSLAASFDDGDLESRMSRYHDDPRSTFHGWADVWLSEEFTEWNISEFLEMIECPILLVQSSKDDYGTLRHLDLIEDSVSGPTQRLVVEGTSHSPHLSHAEEVTEAVVDFVTAKEER